MLNILYGVWFGLRIVSRPKKNLLIFIRVVYYRKVEDDQKGKVFFSLRAFGVCGEVIFEIIMYVICVSIICGKKRDDILRFTKIYDGNLDCFADFYIDNARRY